MRILPALPSSRGAAASMLDPQSGDPGASPGGKTKIVAGSSTGRTPGSDPGKRGSSPCPATKGWEGERKDCAAEVFTGACDPSKVEERVQLPPAAPSLACRLAGGCRTLNPKTEVRILAGQPEEGGLRSCPGVGAGGASEPYKPAGRVQLPGARDEKFEA